MSPTTMLEEMTQWLDALPGDFAFLLALPAIVALAAVGAAALRHWHARWQLSRPGVRHREARAGRSRRGRHRPA
jgi:hypothetical protein